jgi:hypothetical protein
MNLTLVLLFAPLAAPSSSLSDADILSAAERAFAEGGELRGDEARARPAFARAADGYDELWRRGHHNPDLALNRASAHRLAGNLPGAIVALNEGLAVARWSRPLQVALEDARAAVAYPVNSDLAAQCRPPAVGGLGSRFSPADVWVAVGVLWLLACGAVARFAMTRAPGWLGFGVPCAACLALLGGLWLKDQRDQRRANEHPLAVVARETTLRKGNAEAYPARIGTRLPRGVEMRKLAERGGWLQVRLADGTVGWIPETSVVRT